MAAGKGGSKGGSKGGNKGGSKGGSKDSGKGGGKGRDRMVYKGPDGKWNNKRNDASRPGSKHNTQKEAEQAAKEMLKKQGGGELIIKGRDGKIRSKDTIAPGNDPFPPRDKEH